MCHPSRMASPRQHYLPASLIGGFGQPSKSGRLREANVAVRRKVTGAVDDRFPRAESLAYRRGVYRLSTPPTGVNPDIVDKLWDPVERLLPDLIDRLANRRLQSGDDDLLFKYAATAAVRHPATFAAVASDYHMRQGLAAPRGDDLQLLLRIVALAGARPVSGHSWSDRRAT
jgi:hypothetical protein